MVYHSLIAIFPITIAFLGVYTIPIHTHPYPIWLVVWNMNFIFPIILGRSSSQHFRTPWFFRGVGSTTSHCWSPASMAILRIHTFDQTWRMPQEDSDWTWTGQTVVTSCCNWISCFVLFKDGNSEYGYGIYIYRIIDYIYRIIHICCRCR